MNDPDGFFADAELARPDPVGLAVVRWAGWLVDRIELVRNRVGRDSWRLECPPQPSRDPRSPQVE